MMQNKEYEVLLEELKALNTNVKPPVPNPAPLGLFAFGFTTALLQLKHTGIAGDDPDDMGGVTAVVIGFAMFFGGFLQVVAGISEIRRNNLLGYTAFLLFGGLWMSIGTFEIIQMLAHPDSDVASPNPKAVSAMLSLAGLFTVVLWICSFKANKTLNLLFSLLFTTLFLLSGGVFDETVDRVAGWFGFATSAVAYWLAAAELFNAIHGEGEREIIPLGTFKLVRCARVQTHDVDVEAPPELVRASG
mmetsp:Transcript_23109/g.42874  ORF Transcript_23109/g.42874 Transcript_23109/m.42874 type:complete len:246 (+) Transcript_23109:1177-1914(+)